LSNKISVFLFYKTAQFIPLPKYTPLMTDEVVTECD